MPNPKLEYDAKTPAFLQRLKGQYGGAGERQNVQFARPKKQLIDHDDDEPTYVDEDSHETISKEEYEKLANNTPQDLSEIVGAAKDDLKPSGPTESDLTRPRDDIQATFGSSNKRKAGKVIAGDEDDDRNVPKENKVNLQDQDNEPATTKPKPQKARKGKKVKLSFDDD